MSRLSPNQRRNLKAQTSSGSGSSASRIGVLEVLPVSAFNAAALLVAWERGVSQPPVQRALTLLATGWPDRSAEDWAHATIGQRDGWLLTLREELFGSRLEAVAACPHCGEQLELTFSTQNIRALAPALHESLRVTASGYEVECRLPTSADLLEMTQPAVASAHEMLLQRCVQAAQCGDTDIDPATLPTEVAAAVMEEMARADPQADVRIALTCPVCRHGWSMTFDILAYLWSEIEDWARRLLQEVHALASIYGWSERDILALSARRRRLYLELMGA